MVKRSVLDFSLRGEILWRINWGDHAFEGEKRCQIGSVRGDEDQGEEPPHGTNNATGYGAWGYVTALLHECAEGEPERVQNAKLVYRCAMTARARPRLLTISTVLTWNRALRIVINLSVPVVFQFNYYYL